MQGKLTRKLKENLELEIRILKSLQHPHIVALFTCTETPSYIYLVMEYCQLSDLAQFMKKRTQLPNIPETADIFKKYPNTPSYGLHEVLVRHFVKQIASALEYLRNRNLIHRDIKPQNLLLNPSPAYMQRQKPEDVPLAASEHSLVPAVGVETLPMLKIADFGFARHLPQQMLAETLCGSPLYMAPEILGYQKYDAKADLWSVGAVTYEMMVGKPPFRASNHMELKKKIDDAGDVIPFPAGLAVSSDLKRMIRSLLKRSPIERTSFEGFFRSTPVTGPIPGLVGEDVPRTSNVPIPDPGVSELSRRMAKQAIDSPAQMLKAAAATPLSASPGTPASTLPISMQTDNVRRASAEMTRRKSSTGNPAAAAAAAAARPMDINRPSNRDRPSLVTHATAPPREYLGGQYFPRNADAIDRKSSRTGPPNTSTSVPKEAIMAVPTKIDRDDQASRDRERTAQDLAFEKEYVMIEKRAVEVNSFADELAARNGRPRSQLAAGQHGAMVRRVTTQGVPTSTTGAQPAIHSNALQAATGNRPDALNARQASFERRYAPSPSSAQNMLSKALNMANARILGGMFGASPPLNAGASPPRGYTMAYPSYPAPAIGLAIAEGNEDIGPLDEDAKILRIVEEAATRSDTVYSFAEVKYRQLLPATPSADDGPGIRQIDAAEKRVQGSGDHDHGEADDDDLTHNALVDVSEEALVLFVKALAILAKCIDLAGYWWNSQARKDPTPGSSPSSGSDSKSSTVEVGKRMNNVVQWARNRFNECMEKSEVVGRRLMEAQKQLPRDHPGHPDNQKQKNGNSSSSNVGASVEQIQLTSGVTAEKLMYDRAIEMSRAAAVNELVNQDIKGCEISYRTAIFLLEAVLDSDDEPLFPSAKKDRPDNQIVNGLDVEDRKQVLDREFFYLTQAPRPY